MFKVFERFTQRKVKSRSSNPGLEHRIVFKKGAVSALMAAKGWRTLTEMADALGLTKSYVSMLTHTRVQVTATVITRLAASMGSVEKNWWVHFEIVPWGVSDPNHPQWNQDKHMGRVPYDRFSTMVHVRGLDYDAERLGPLTYTENPRKRRKIQKTKKTLTV